MRAILFPFGPNAARYAVDVAAFCSGALVMVSGMTGHRWLAIGGLALMVVCGGLLSALRR